MNPECVCTLQLTAKERRWLNCGRSNCEHCGWSIDEQQRRRELMRTDGLTLCDGGLKRLKISREARHDK